MGTTFEHDKNRLISAVVFQAVVAMIQVLMFLRLSFNVAHTDAYRTGMDKSMRWSMSQWMRLSIFAFNIVGLGLTSKVLHDFLQGNLEQSP